QDDDADLELQRGERIESLPSDGSAGDCLRSVRDSLRRLPHQGLGFGLLKWQEPDALAQPLRALPGAPVLFNYLGQLDASAATSALFALTEEDTGPSADPAASRDYLLEVNGSVLGGSLRVSFGYSSHLHTAATLERLAQRFLHHLRALISARHSEDARRFSPGDFPLAAVSQQALDALLREAGPDVEDLYPLSPVQQGLLFHWLLSPESSVYFEQLAWTMRGPLDLEAFRQAWRASLERHAPLRTSFHWEGLESPLQVVHARAELPFELLDWRELSASEQQAHFQRLLDEDRQRGFELRRAPLLRLTVMRLAEDAHRILWSHHHLLLDGWSLGVLLEDVFALYETARSGGSARASSRPPFRDYIAWLGRRDSSADEAFWRSTLDGFSTPTPLPADTHAVVPRGQPSTQHTLEAVLSPEESTALLASARRQQLTLHTLALASWALVLSRYSGEDDVLFGTTVAGRPPELPGSEAMVGLFINTLPTRVRIPSAGSPLLPWLQSLQEHQLQARQHEQLPLVQLQALTPLARGTPLFESLLVVENYPLDASLQQRSALSVQDVRSFERTNYPLTLAVLPGDSLRLRLSYEMPRVESAAMERLLGQWRQALTALVAPTATRLGDVSLLSASERQQVVEEWNQTRADFPGEACIHHLFERQVALRPESIALEF
ncbi:MAG: condensation domain-containing protein, partial [Archangium sp.]